MKRISIHHPFPHQLPVGFSWSSLHSVSLSRKVSLAQHLKQQGLLKTLADAAQGGAPVPLTAHFQAEILGKFYQGV